MLVSLYVVQDGDLVRKVHGDTMGYDIHYMESCHEYRVDLVTRTIFIIGDIDSDISRLVITNLHILDQTDGTINIILNSVGGDVDDGLAIYDAIRTTRNETVLTVTGNASSIAGIFMQAADRRIMSKYASIMLHNAIYSYDEDDASCLEARAEESKRMRMIFAEILANKSGIKKTDWLRWLKVDKYFSAQDALKYKLVDKII